MRTKAWQQADRIVCSTNPNPIEARIATLELILCFSPDHEAARLELARHQASIGIAST